MDAILDELISNEILMNLLTNSQHIGESILVLFTTVMIIKTLVKNEPRGNVINIFVSFIFLTITNYNLKLIVLPMLDLIASKVILLFQAGFSAENSSVWGNIAVATAGTNFAVAMYLVMFLMLLVFFIKFLLMIARYTLQLYVILAVFPAYALEILANGYLEYINYLFQIGKIFISMFIISLFMAIGINFIAKAIVIVDNPLTSVVQLILAYIFLSSKKTVEQALGKLGVFTQGAGTVGAISRAGYSIQAMSRFLK